MDLDAKTFAILSLTFGVIVALIWDWIVILLNEMDGSDKWWEDIEEEDVDDEQPKRRKK